MTVEQLARQLDLWETLRAALAARLAPAEQAPLLARLAALPVRPSHASRRFGSYQSRGGTPLCIRLQFVLEPQPLRETFLHELAHACDHLYNQPGRPYRLGHGPGWRAWAACLGIAPERCGQSAALDAVHESRLKVVAICRGCGAEIRRVRRLPRGRRYLHPPCGGALVPV